MHNKKSAFTLIEVMVSVMIISVVIMALLKMYANNTHIFTSIKEQIKTNEYSSLLISNANYGFEDKELYLDDLVVNYDLEDDLRRELNAKKAKLTYDVVQNIDLSAPDATSEQDDNEKNSNSSLVLEIGRDVLKTKKFSVALMRLRIK